MKIEFYKEGTPEKDLKTTQIYAKIVDESKRKAADKIKLDL